MTHSQAAVFEGIPGQLRLATLRRPEPVGEELLVRVLGCTLCASDLHTVEGRRKVPVPTVLGHEIVGRIVGLGNAARPRDLAGRELALGDRVTWAIVAHCEACPPCERGLPQKCRNGVKYGHEPFRPGRELLGGFAEHCLLVPGTSIVRLPEDLPLEVACPASCATATIVAALEAASQVEGRRVCVIGAGMLGLTALAMARSRNTADLWCVEPNDDRREKALAFGADRVLSPSEFAAAGPRTGAFDVILELSGHPEAFSTAWPSLEVGGVLVLVGSVFPSPPVALSLDEVVRRHVTIRGVHNYAPSHLLMAVDFLASSHSRFPFAGLVREWLPLWSITEAFARSRDPRGIRVGVFPGERPPA